MIDKCTQFHESFPTEWDTAPETENEVLLRLKQNPFLSDSYYGPVSYTHLTLPTN